MATDKIRKYVLPNIPYLFIGWFCLKIGTAYRLAAGAGFGEKLLGLGQTIGAVGQSALLESAIGDHLHFAVSKDGDSVDPMEFLGK